MSYLLRDIAQKVHGEIIGDDSIRVSSLSTIDEIAPQSLVFADSNEHLKLAEASLAAAVLVDRHTLVSEKPLIQVDHPLKAFITLMHYFNPPTKMAAGTHPTAVISDNVKLGNNIYIGPYVVIESGSIIEDNCVLKSQIYIGQNVIIGKDSIIHPHVTIYDHCQIGSNVIIHASTVIGSDGFGYIYVDDKHVKIPHLGRVIIENNVEIGANAAIDRATMGATVIGEGTKIDNFVQVAHSVKLGKHNILCGFTGIAGSTTTGNGVIFAANVGVSDHVRIDNNVVLGARTGVPPKKHLREGNVYLGNPARPKDIAIEHELSVNRIPLMRKNIKTLKEEVDLLKQKLAEKIDL